MAKKKSSLETDLESADFMTILSGGGTSRVFRKNNFIDYSYPTGISILDYALGYDILIRDDSGEVIGKRRCLGLQAGSVNIVTGKTQSFKTTLTMQIISNIAYANGGNIVHYDAENRLVLERAKIISKLPEDWFSAEFPRYALKKGAVGYNTLQSDITEIYENKMRHKDLITKDTGVVDSRNNPIKLMPPTIVFVDSLQNLINDESSYNIDSKNFDDSRELRNNMYGAQSAKTLRGLITDVIPMLSEANIILMMIAHKTSNVSMTPFSGVSKQFQYGSNNERISGGSSVEYNTSAVINLTGKVDNDSRYHLETDGFDGNTVLLEPTKSSTNESGNAKTGLGFELVIDKRKEGIDNIRSLILFLKNRGRLKGNKSGYKVIDLNGEETSTKFSWKNVYNDFKTNPLLYKNFMIAAKEELETLVAPAIDTSGTINPFDVDSIINSL